MYVPRRRRGRRPVLLAAAVLVAGGLAACGGTSTAGSGAATTVNVVGFSVIKSAVDQLGAAFEKTPAGAGVTIEGSYGASGAQSRAVIAGQKADVVTFSLTPDLEAVADAGLVDPSWSAGPDKGILSDSIVVIAVRKGNPKRITGWADLVRPGIGIVTADPGTSGSAKWNLLAAYAQALGPTRDAAAAKTYLAAFIKNVVSWNDSGRSATDAFSAGTGDVLISYENEAIAARAAGVGLDYLVPTTTILIQNPWAVTRTASTQAKAFLTFVGSPAGQRILAANGFRPVDPGVTGTAVKGADDPTNPFPTVPDLITISELGGWSAANTTFFDKTTGLVTRLRTSP